MEMPPISNNKEGEERTVGYEFEFTGVKIDKVAEIVQDLYGGNIVKKSTFEYEVKETEFGDFTLELDAQMLREKSYETLFKKVGIDISKYQNKEAIEDHLMEAASSVVPYEIVTPPVKLSQMETLEELIKELRFHKAKGTGSSMLYAFGLHINPEITDEKTETILNTLKAYVLLDGWIRKDAKVDLSRRATPFIKPYHENYLELILKEGYEPDLTTFISDYFEYDNSRNRALDLLPVFMYLNEEKTSALIEDTLTSARPTYHYRLPNCSLEDPDWALSNEWNRWVLVEKLANDKQQLSQYCRAYFKLKNDTLFGFEKKWIELMDRWVHNV